VELFRGEEERKPAVLGEKPFSHDFPEFPIPPYGIATQESPALRVAFIIVRNGKRDRICME
jgi:hypothetical protein